VLATGLDISYFVFSYSLDKEVLSYKYAEKGTYGGPFFCPRGPNFQPCFSGPNFQPLTAKIVHECFYENVRSIFHGNSILDFLSCITSKWALFMRRLIDIKVPFHMHSNF